MAVPGNDRKIEVAAESSYTFRAVLEDSVRVKSEDGVVTLTGIVKDQNQEDLAVDTVRNLPGVNKVKNELTIKSLHKERSDAWMAFKIRSLLLMKANVSVASTKVAVKDGVVRLTGTAENAAQKELTSVSAKEIEGVKSVENDMVVEPKDDTDESVSEIIDDASITAQVKYALLNHKATRALKTSIATVDGEVTLEGSALNEAERSLAGKLAKDVRGVKSVNNEMSVKK